MRMGSRLRQVAGFAGGDPFGAAAQCLDGTSAGFAGSRQSYVFGMGGSNTASMVGMQPQQHGAQGGFGNITSNSQNMQQTMTSLPNNPNFQQQRQQNQQ